MTRSPWDPPDRPSTPDLPGRAGVPDGPWAAPTDRPDPAAGPASADPWAAPGPAAAITSAITAPSAAPGAAPATTPATATAGGQARTRRRRLLVIGPLALLIGAGAAGGGTVAVQHWLEQQRIGAAQAALKEGRADFARADCAAALAVLPRAREPKLDPGTTRIADDLVEPCRALQVARAETGAADRKVLAYLTFLSDHTDPALASAARREGQAAVLSVPPARLATSDLCRSLPGVVQYGLIPRDRLATLEPALILPCATAYEAGSPELAVAGFRDLLVRYPHSREAPTATLHLARLIFTTKTAREPADYAPPAPYKTDPSLGSSAVLTVYNGTIQPLAVTVVGPEGAVFQVIPPCTTCQVYDNDAEARCSYSSPHITVKIPAGRHGLDIWYTRSEFRLRGLWTARSSKAYRDCFFQTR